MFKAVEEFEETAVLLAAMNRGNKSDHRDFEVQSLRL